MDFTPVKLALRYCEMDFTHVNLDPHYCEMNFRPVKLFFHVVWQCVFPKKKITAGKTLSLLVESIFPAVLVVAVACLLVLTICLLPALAIMFPWRPMASASRLWG